MSATKLLYKAIALLQTGMSPRRYNQKLETNEMNCSALHYDKPISKSVLFFSVNLIRVL